MQDNAEALQGSIRRDAKLRLCKALVSLHLEYCEQLWTLYLRTDVLALERVQRRFTRMILE